MLLESVSRIAMTASSRRRTRCCRGQVCPEGLYLIDISSFQADKRFFTLLKKAFTWEEVADDPEREVYSREAISLLRLHRK